MLPRAQVPRRWRLPDLMEAERRRAVARPETKDLQANAQARRERGPVAATRAGLNGGSRGRLRKRGEAPVVRPGTPAMPCSLHYSRLTCGFRVMDGSGSREDASLMRCAWILSAVRAVLFGSDTLFCGLILFQKGWGRGHDAELAIWLIVIGTTRGALPGLLVVLMTMPSVKRRTRFARARPVGGRSPIFWLSLAVRTALGGAVGAVVV